MRSDGGPVGHDVPSSVQFQNSGLSKSCIDRARGVFAVERKTEVVSARTNSSVHYTRVFVETPFICSYMQIQVCSCQ